MYYKKLEANELLKEKEKEHNYEKQVIDLLEKENSHLKLVSLKKEDGFESHVSHTDVFIYVLDGELEIIFPKDSSCGCGLCGCDLPDEDDNTAKKYKISKNQMFMFEKEVNHSVKALKDTKFLLVKM